MDASPKTNLLFLLEPTAMAGAEKVVINLINYLDEKKFSITLAVPSRYLAEFQSSIFKKIEYFRYDVDPSSKISLRRFDLLKQIADRNFDIISTHQNLPMIYLSIINPPATIIHTQHIAEKWRRWFWPDPFSENSNDQYIAVSRPVRDFLIAEKHIPAPRITVIHNGIDLEQYHARPPIELKAKLGIGAEDVIIGFLGRLSPQKNLGTFLDIAKSVSRRSANYKFFIVGQGPSEITLKEKAARENIPVDFIGWTDRPYDYLEIFDIFLNTSLYEGMSLAHLESLYAGNYLVTTPVEGIQDLQEKLVLKVIDNYQPADFVDTILNYRPPDLSGNQVVIREYFSAEVMTKQYEKIFSVKASYWDKEIKTELSTFEQERAKKNN